jgi:hypothetical protein
MFGSEQRSSTQYTDNPPPFVEPISLWKWSKLLLGFRHETRQDLWRHPLK